MGAPTYVSLNRKVTDLLGYRWIYEPRPTIPKTRDAVCRALKSGKLKAAVKRPLYLIEKRTRFAKALHRDKIKGYKNCVNLMRYLRGGAQSLRTGDLQALGLRPLSFTSTTGAPMSMEMAIADPYWALAEDAHKTKAQTVHVIGP
jgi:hypothetical protein